MIVVESRGFQTIPDSAGLNSKFALSHAQVFAPTGLIHRPGMFKCLTFALRGNPLVHPLIRAKKGRSRWNIIRSADADRRTTKKRSFEREILEGKTIQRVRKMTGVSKIVWIVCTEMFALRLESSCLYESYLYLASCRWQLGLRTITSDRATVNTNRLRNLEIVD